MKSFEHFEAVLRREQKAKSHYTAPRILFDAALLEECRGLAKANGRSFPAQLEVWLTDVVERERAKKSPRPAARKGGWLRIAPDGTAHVGVEIVPSIWEKIKRIARRDGVDCADAFAESLRRGIADLLGSSGEDVNLERP